MILSILLKRKDYFLIIEVSKFTRSFFFTLFFFQENYLIERVSFFLSFFFLNRRHLFFSLLLSQLFSVRFISFDDFFFITSLFFYHSQYENFKDCRNTILQLLNQENANKHF